MTAERAALKAEEKQLLALNPNKTQRAYIRQQYDLLRSAFTPAERSISCGSAAPSAGARSRASSRDGLSGANQNA